MARGNRTNHPLKWARDKDLKELKELFTSFVENDFKHLTKDFKYLTTRVGFQDIKITFLLVGIGIILAMMGFLLTLLFKVI